jgi:hypothetical protein
MGADVRQNTIASQAIHRRTNHSEPVRETEEAQTRYYRAFARNNRLRGSDDPATLKKQLMTAQDFCVEQ